MIFGHISQVFTEYCWLPEVLKKALHHLHETDFTCLPAGSYELDGKDMYVQVFDFTTQLFNVSRAEVHREYIDIHFLVHGTEAMGFATDTGNNRVSENLFVERDIAFYEDMEYESTLVMRPGNFVIFFPNDVHRPTCTLTEPCAIRKIVMKIKLKLVGQGH